MKAVSIASQGAGGTFIAHGTARYVDASGVMDALNDGEYVIIGEHNLLRLGESHFLLFLPGRGDNPNGIHCIDSDKAIDSDPDVWPLEAVISAGESLFGQGAAIGIALRIAAGPAPQGSGVTIPN